MWMEGERANEVFEGVREFVAANPSSFKSSITQLRKKIPADACGGRGDCNGGTGLKAICKGEGAALNCEGSATAPNGEKSSWAVVKR